MTTRAQLNAQRAKRQAAVTDSYLQHDRANQKAERQAAQRPPDPVERAALYFWNNLQSNNEEARKLAQLLFKDAPKDVRAKVKSMADVNSAFKKRRSRQRNGF